MHARDQARQNGTVGTLVRLSGSELEVRLDDARTLRFDRKHYADLTHGYAATIHKVQGATFDKAYGRATRVTVRRTAAMAGLGRTPQPGRFALGTQQAARRPWGWRRKP
jgi:hypothetical protein